jgi:hypothetical protein
MNLPLAYRWDGKAMVPVPYFADEAKRSFIIGDMYRLAEVNERSSNTHNHYFASLTEAWRNLPEEIAPDFPSVEHLRKWALIRTGYCDIQKIAVASEHDAKSLATFARTKDEFAVVTIAENIVTIATAKSQSYRAMDKQEFASSKTDVLECVAGMARTTTEKLAESARVNA